MYVAYCGVMVEHSNVVHAFTWVLSIVAEIQCISWGLELGLKTHNTTKLTRRRQGDLSSYDSMALLELWKTELFCY